MLFTHITYRHAHTLLDSVPSRQTSTKIKPLWSKNTSRACELKIGLGRQQIQGRMKRKIPLLEEKQGDVFKNIYIKFKFQTMSRYSNLKESPSPNSWLIFWQHISVVWLWMKLVLQLNWMNVNAIVTVVNGNAQWCYQWPNSTPIWSGNATTFHALVFRDKYIKCCDFTWNHRI